MSPFHDEIYLARLNELRLAVIRAGDTDINWDGGHMVALSRALKSIDDDVELVALCSAHSKIIRILGTLDGGRCLGGVFCSVEPGVLRPLADHERMALVLAWGERIDLR